MWSKVFEEFRKFVLRGNVIDLAVGVIIATSFAAIVDSLVDDILMPPLGFVLNGIDMSDWQIVLKAATPETEAIAVRFGLFIQVIVEFAIIAVACFVIIKTVNTIIERFKEKSPPQKSENELLMETMVRLAEAMENQNRLNRRG